MNTRDRDRLRKKRRELRQHQRTGSLRAAQTQRVTALNTGVHLAKIIASTPAVIAALRTLIDEGISTVEFVAFVFHRDALAAYVGLGFDPAEWNPTNEYTMVCLPLEGAHDALKPHQQLRAELDKHEEAALGGAVRFVAWRSPRHTIVFPAVMPAKDAPQEPPATEPEPA